MTDIKEESATPNLPERQDAEELKAPLQRLYTVGKLMDSQFKVPILGRVGFDPLIGLIPVVGDLVGYLVSAYIIVEAGRMGVPAKKLGKMSVNALLDALTGYIPVAGDVVDVAYKANARNVNIVLEHFDADIDTESGEFKKLPVQKTGLLSTKGKIILWTVVVLIILLLAAIIAIPILLAYWIFAK